MNAFKKYLQDYDASVASSMRAAGYKLKNQSSRTVLFTFGEVTITRNRWYKNGKCKIPVDEKLGLKPYERISSELLYQIIYLSTLLPYRKIEEVFELLLQSLVSKDTVQKAVKLATKTLKEKADYKKIKEESSIQKIKAPKIYLEGDGVMLKTTDRNNDFQSTDFSHFVVHTGSYKESSKRT
ncbi:ISLre2 family transposase, partial [Streptococcus agalactiae]|nr:ISLre2 family transposase [Streptococcus agalactiae]